MLDFEAIFNATPGLHMVLGPGPEFCLLAVNDSWLTATGATRAQVLGVPIFVAFPERPDMPEIDGVENVLESLRIVLDTKRPHTMAVQRYDVRDPEGEWQERYWKPVHIPVYASPDSEEITYILQCAEDLTNVVKFTGQKEW